MSAMIIVVLESDSAFPLAISDECLALCSGPTSRIGNSQECEDSAHDDRTRPSSLNRSSPERVTDVIRIRMIRECRHGEISTVHSYHTRLC